MEYAQIDWHSFVIVETINFRESEAGRSHRSSILIPSAASLSLCLSCPGYLPPPIHSSQLAQRLLQQQKYERLDEGGEVQEIEMELEENDAETTTESKEMVRTLVMVTNVFTQTASTFS